MPNAIFLFDGGEYKRGTDDGRSRVPLTTTEAQMIFYDPELPGDTDNSIGAELNMQKYSSEFCDLAVGDEIFVGVVPDAAVYRGLWMMSFDAIAGLQMDLDLVSVSDVYNAHLLGDATGVAAWDAAALSYDFADGVGQATKDTYQQLELHGGVYADYRNNDAVVGVNLAAPKIALLGEALYLRLTVTENDSTVGDSSCCSTCLKDTNPTFQVGAVYDRMCVDKQRVRNFCNCPVEICDDDPCTIGCKGPLITSLTVDYEYEPDRVVQFRILLSEDSDGAQGVPRFVTDPEGAFELDEFGDGGSSFYMYGYWSVELTEGMTFTFTIPAGAFISQETGLPNCLSETITYTIPAPAE